MDPPRDQWTCPETGLIVPKSMEQNLLWRQALRRRADSDAGFKKMILTACSISPLFWINGFVWTYRQKRVDEKGNDVPVTGPQANVPFITWTVQDEALTAVLEAIPAGEDINFEKSRDMGASWLLLTLADHFLLFVSDSNIGTVSRKEELVDKTGDMDTLFEKIRYIHRMLPGWMLPQIRDRFLFLHNLELNSSISGESTNTEVGRGGRKTFYLVDEAAAISQGEAVEASLSQNTPCQIWASTPHGPNTQFHRRIKEKRGRLIQLPWYRHPEKAAGAHQIIDESGRIRWTSPWYEHQQAKFSRKTIAQEVDMDHGQAGDMFFEYTELNRHREDHQSDPIAVGGLIWTDALTQEQKVDYIRMLDTSHMLFIKKHNRSPWRLWCDLRNGRPPQYWTYVFGIDISNGTGASNSVITVMALETRQIVAKFWDAYTSPEELAIVAAMSGVWFGGLRQPAFIAWENNGPGGIFGLKLMSMHYPMFYRQRNDNTLRNKKTSRWGWHSNAERKQVLLGMYRDALSRDDIINPCQQALDEAADYIYDDSGHLIPATVQSEPLGGRSLHGDHVIADALAWLAAKEMPHAQENPVGMPEGSYAWRKKDSDRKARANNPWNA